MTRTLSDLCRNVRRRLFSRSAEGTNKKPARLGIESLEDRMCPVIGGFDIPGTVDTGAGYDGVGRINLASGALLSTARHVLTAAHVSSDSNRIPFAAPTRFTVDSPAGRVVTPGATFTTPQQYVSGDTQNYDIGVMTLAELGPLDVERYDLYAGSDEVGKVGRMVGWGATGTGTSGMATDIQPGQFHPTDVGTATNYELVRFTIRGNPGSGSFVPYLSNSIGNGQTVPLGTGVNGLRSALLAMPGITNVQVRLVGDWNGDGHVDNWNVPHAGSYEALFLGVDEAHMDPNEKPNTINHSMADVVVFDSFPQPNQYVEVETLLQGGSPIKRRTALNGIGAVSGTGAELIADFDNGFNSGNTLGDGFGQGSSKEGLGSFGDSGSPLFINGRIAGVAVHLIGNGGNDGNAFSSDFGDQETWTRVNFHRAFLESIINDPRPYDLVLNMNSQSWGNDGVDDSVRVNAANGKIRISIDGVVRYEDDLSKIKSVRIQGSEDDETISIESLGAAIPITVNGGEGNDVIRVVGLALGAPAIVDGGEGDDLVAVGAGFLDLAGRIKGDLSVYGGRGSDRVEFRDQNGAGVAEQYVLSGPVFSYSKMVAPVFYTGVESVGVFTNDHSAEVTIGSSPAHSIDVTGGSGYDVFRVSSYTAATYQISVNGGGDGDELYISDAALSVPKTHRFGQNTYSVAGESGLLSYSSVKNVHFFAGQSHDTIELKSSPANVNLTLDGNGGDDDFILGTGDLDQIGGPVTISGGIGHDTVTLNDTSEFAHRTYELAAFGVSRANVDVGMLSIAEVTLNASAADNTFLIRGTPGLTTINAGLGNDLFHLSPDDRELNDLTGGLILNGDGGSDMMVADDRNYGGSAAYTLTGSTLTRDGFAGVLFDGMEDVWLRLSDNANTVNVQGSKAGTDVRIDGNGGNDTFRVAGTLRSNVRLFGGSGFDRLVWLPGSGMSGAGSIQLSSIESVEFPLGG